MSAPNILDEIAAAHRKSWESETVDLATLIERASTADPIKDFTSALARPGISVIAELKRRSPSAGVINANLDPHQLASAYEAGGASCLSVLTDEKYFGGCTQDLMTARNAVDIPALRKDFTVDERDIAVARVMGADAILLIVAILNDNELKTFLRLANELGLGALVEVHDETELDRAIDAGASIIGVNQRNLKDFSIDRNLAAHLKAKIPTGVITVAESGIRSAGDVQQLAEIGYDAILVGTTLASATTPEQTLRDLVSF